MLQHFEPDPVGFVLEIEGDLDVMEHALNGSVHGSLPILHREIARSHSEQQTAEKHDAANEQPSRIGNGMVDDGEQYEYAADEQ